MPDRGWLAATIVLSLWLGLTLQAHAGQLGADVNADVDAFGHSQMDADSLGAFARTNTVYPRPMFNQVAGDHVGYWENMVEQYQSAQLDFVAVWLKGNNQPATCANLVSALRARGAVGRVKVMPFDDNPASWTALWNYDHGNGYNYKVPFDVSAPANWAYVWDKNLKEFFENVPDADRFKIKGRPVYRIWSGSPAFLANLNGHGSALLNYLRQQCQSTFGFNPYIMVPEDWVKNDPSSARPGVVDAVCPWFTPVPGPNYLTWNTDTWQGVTTGACIPEFHISNTSDPNAPVWIVDSQHGRTLAAGLAGTTGKGHCVATFIEGFDDYWENTTLWRARNRDADGQALGYAQTHYDYPNQRINVVRRYSNNPFPTNLQEEAAGCDSFSGAVARPGRQGFYRNGDIAIEATADRQGGYDVTDTQKGETLNWLQVPIEGHVHLQVRAATTLRDRRMHFVIDGKAYPPVTIPDTDGAQRWATVDMGEYTFPADSEHAVTLICDNGGVNVHWWRVQTLTLPDGTYRIVDVRSGDPWGGQWELHPDGPDRYSVRSAASAHLLGDPGRWTITPQPNGFCTITAPGSARGQEWTLAPVH